MIERKRKVVPVILAGGQGTRLWPASLPAFPKQFLKIGEETLIEQAVKRVLPLGDEILILTSQQYFDLFPVHMSLPKEYVSKITLIGEPSARNTAPAIALALRYIQEKYQDAIMLLITADQIIHSTEQFIQDAHIAIEHALAGNIVTFGIYASKPETGYGYIECGEKRGNEKETVLSVVSFREKPDYETAKQYIASGNFFWNSGMFCFSVTTMYKEYSLYAKELFHTVLHDTFEWNTGAVGGFVSYTPVYPQFMTLEKVSIDYAIMEHTQKAVVVPARFHWNDVGSWDEVTQYIEATQKVYTQDAYNVSVRSDIPVAISGVSDIVVVHENNRLLILRKGTGQTVSYFAKQDVE